jgi:hypothetical protein
MTKKSCTENENDQVHQSKEKLLQQIDSNRKQDSPSQTTPAKEPEPIEHLIEAMMTEIWAQTSKEVEGEIFCLEAMFPFQEDGNHPLMACKASSDPNTM